MKENQITASMAKDIAFKLGAVLNDEEAEIFADGYNAAMLQGVEPVSQTYELPQTQFEQVADLYEMQFDDGRTCAFHTDGAKAAQWLLACDGNKVQEYVRIERYQEAVIGNSPVIPDGWVMVPKEPTQAMIKAWLSEIANFRGHAAGYRAALEAAPQLEVK
ncbi:MULTISPECIES: eaa protein [Salmonella]|uniref:eaa protein n=1 Tax=Salmonella TaxID=590 RepID=UPI0006D4B063|nr:Eaa protein [Salmonella enterica subsp. enterica serovar Weltevreden]